MHAVADATMRLAPPGRSSSVRSPAGPTVAGSKMARSACAPSADAAAVADAVQPRGHVGEEVHGFFERDVAGAHGVADHERRVARARHHVEVRARVGSADDRAAVAPHFGAHLPHVVGLGSAEVGTQARAEAVGEHDVEQARRTAVARAPPRCRRSACLRGARLGREALDDFEAFPARESGEHARFLGVARCSSSRARVAGSAQRAHAFVERQRERLAPTREAVEHEAGEEREPDAHALRQRERNDAAAAFGGAGAGRRVGARGCRRRARRARSS